jgi:hypothetical protein
MDVCLVLETFVILIHYIFEMYLTGFEDGFLEGVKYVSNQVNATAKNIREMN